MSSYASHSATRLVPVVEITTRPPALKRRRRSREPSDPKDTPKTRKNKRRRRYPSPGSAESHSSISGRRSPGTVRKSSPTSSTNRRKALPSSPTVSEFAYPIRRYGALTNVEDVLIPSTSSTEPHAPPSSRPLSPLVYDLQSTDITDEIDLLLAEEAAPDLQGPSDSDSEEDEDVPIRKLDDFIIFDLKTLEVVHISELLDLDNSSRVYGAAGLVKPFFLGDEDDDGTDSDDMENSPPIPQLTKLSEVLELNAHHYNEDDQSIDNKIYIRTRHAWYILESPSVEYQPYFKTFAAQHHALQHLLEVSLTDPHIIYEDFIETLPQTRIPTIGRPLTLAEFESSEIRMYIISTLPGLHKKLHHSRLLKDIANAMGLSLRDIVGSTSAKGPASRPKVPRVLKNQPMGEKSVLKHRNNTVVTPIVSRIAQGLFRPQLEVAGATSEELADQRLVHILDDVKAHHMDPESMKWGQPIAKGSGYYYSIIMDGVVYEIGDVVMVNPGEDDDAVRALNATASASHSKNIYGNHVWFCRICYFFEEKHQKYFHGQWFVHGSKTILQETAHSKSLYLTMECADNPAASIFKKCNITMLTPEDNEKADDDNPEANDFHCGLVWDQESSSFTDLPTLQEILDANSYLPPTQPCFSCFCKLKQSQMEGFQPSSHGFIWNGVSYHLFDFVYLLQGLSRPEVYQIAQIVEVRMNEDEDKPDIFVTFCGRYNELPNKVKEMGQSKEPIAFHDRRLYLEFEVTAISMDQLDGVCYVKYLTQASEIEEWVKESDHFYLNEELRGQDRILCRMNEDHFYNCKRCMRVEEKRLEQVERYKRYNQPLRGLELFSGAGGLGTGLDLSGFVKTRYAVEFSPSAAATYQHNHPETVVYCQDSNLLLRHAIDTHEGKDPQPLRSNNGKSLCPAMPPKGSVDFIYGGPPCQSFSGANHHKKADDIRSTLPGNMLSYLEFYEADYFLLENVKGMLSHPLMSEQDNLVLKGGIKAGVVKLIMRVLIALGYQVHVKLLQAGHYGAPQGRLRVIFFGAKRGLKLPEFPIPEYAFPDGAHFASLPTGERLAPATRSKVPGNYHQCAPLKPITINQSIGDLPSFDWANPHLVIKQKPQDKDELVLRARKGIVAYDAVDCKDNKVHDREGLVGFPTSVPYLQPPQNMYQLWMRQQSNMVEDQCTKRFAAGVVEGTVTLPFKPNATHRDLPIQLRPRMAKPGQKQEKKVFYGRPNGDEHFKTALTTLTPLLKGTWPIHPSQKRIFTVRECARAQGFPDNYIFLSADKHPQRTIVNQIRQIGNAVPVPLALALGKTLGAALIENWEKNEREESPII
ncbi:hypothetical protein AX16_008781 [Volvariella volvacea WC 439]|nr:hypothetical protein AX16_008781 [Volvariella volvacea WC 439]